jgi:hypothetical protein
MSYVKRVIKCDTEDAFIGDCENCGRHGDVRRIEAIGHMGESRGYYDICFECIGPRVQFKAADGRRMWAPLPKGE